MIWADLTSFCKRDFSSCLLSLKFSSEFIFSEHRETIWNAADQICWDGINISAFRTGCSQSLLLQELGSIIWNYQEANSEQMWDGSFQLICGCCTRLTIGLTYHGHLILSLLEIYPLLNSRIVYASFMCFMLAACTHLGLLPHDPIINVLEGFLSSLNKLVAEFRILYGCVMSYYYMPPRFTWKNPTVACWWVCFQVVISSPHL